MLSDEPRVRDRLLHIVKIDLLKAGTRIARAVKRARPTARRTVQILVAAGKRQRKGRLPETGAQTAAGRHLEPRRRKTQIEAIKRRLLERLTLVHHRHLDHIRQHAVLALVRLLVLLILLVLVGPFDEQVARQDINETNTHPWR